MPFWSFSPPFVDVASSHQKFGFNVCKPPVLQNLGVGEGAVVVAFFKWFLASFANHTSP
jgi:hypothetical protein